jgi:DNA polymerase-3 subunit beta
MGFSNRYLMDALNSCDTEEIKLEMTTSYGPLVITPVEGDSFLFIVLPVRIAKEND